jgi:hypothetical protein
MLRAYVSAGFNPSDFWGLSPRLYVAQMAGARDRMDQEAKRAAWLSWHIAALQRMETMPDAETFINGKAAGKQAQTPEVLSAMGLAMARAFGAKEVI